MFVIITKISRNAPPQTKEQYYYRYLFESYYKGMGHVIPYFWMPKFVDAKDSSARTLNVYQSAPDVASQ